MKHDRILARFNLSEILFERDSKASLNNQLVLVVCFAGAILSFVSWVGNYFLDLGQEMIALSFYTFIFFAILYSLGRFRKTNRLYFYAISLISIVFMNLGWLYNYGSKGPILSLFIIFYAFIIFIWDRKMIAVATFILLINLSLLSYIEYSNSEIVGSYVDEQTRIIDMYVGILISMILMLSLAALIKKHYKKEYSQARKSDQLKSAFLENISHEVRTPLNAIVGLSSLVADPGFGHKEKAEFMKLIDQNSEYLLNLVEDMVNLSELKTHLLEFKIDRVDLMEVFERLRLNFVNLIAFEKLELAISYELDENVRIIETDSKRLEQVLRNLIGNAIKFTPMGKVVFGCRMFDFKPVFFVSDTGMGIDPVTKDQVFDQFAKFNKDDKELRRGTGIGLSLSKEIIQQLGGNIWFDSELGRGTVFFFTLGN